MTVEELLKAMDSAPDQRTRLAVVLNVMATDLDESAQSLSDGGDQIKHTGLPEEMRASMEADLRQQVTGIQFAATHLREWIEHDWERGGEGSEDG